MKNIIFIKIISLIFTFNEYAYCSLKSPSVFSHINTQDKKQRLILESNQRKGLQNQNFKKEGDKGNKIRKIELNSSCFLVKDIRTQGINLIPDKVKKKNY